MNFKMNKEYVQFTNTRNPKHKAGLYHLYGELRTALICSYIWNLKPILPVWWMRGRWQSGTRKYSNLSEYYDFSRLTIKKRKIECFYSTDGLDPNLILNTDLPIESPGGYHSPANNVRTFDKHDYFLPKSSFVIEESKKVSHKLGDEYGVIHIRRTDKLTEPNDTHRDGYSISHYDTATRPKNIIDTLKNTDAPKNIYMMTDEPRDSDIIKELQKNTDYDFYFYFMFDGLEEIKAKDNYLLFAIEGNIAKCNDNNYFRFTTDFCKNLENKK